MNRRAWLRWLIGLVVSGLFLWLAFRSVNASEMWSMIKGADERFLVPAILCTFATFVLRGWRWQLCFESGDRLGFREAFAAYSLGLASSQVIPARLGDLVRVYVVGQMSDVSKSKALGTLVIERLSDMFAIVIMLTLLVPFFTLPSWVKVADGFAAVLAIVALIVVYALAQRSQTLTAPDWIARSRALALPFRLFVQLLSGFSAVKDWRRGLVILGLAFGLWIVQTGTYALTLAAVHLPLGWAAGALVTCVLALAAIIPAGPGFAGSFEIAAQNVLALFGVGASQATGYLEYSRIPTTSAVLLSAVCGLLLWRFGARHRIRPIGISPASAGAATAAGVLD
ncbi:MAG: flippase-like domain-containing protein [Chloroflexi bacterium]|nr:flippase-like domain-containing protein [Chloroflexota bacterium]